MFLEVECISPAFPLKPVPGTYFGCLPVLEKLEMIARETEIKFLFLSSSTLCFLGLLTLDTSSPPPQTSAIHACGPTAPHCCSDNELRTPRVSQDSEVKLSVVELLASLSGDLV